MDKRREIKSGSLEDGLHIDEDVLRQFLAEQAAMSTPETHLEVPVQAPLPTPDSGKVIGKATFEIYESDIPIIYANRLGANSLSQIAAPVQQKAHENDQLQSYDFLNRAPIVTAPIVLPTSSEPKIHIFDASDAPLAGLARVSEAAQKPQKKIIQAELKESKHIEQSTEKHKKRSLIRGLAIIAIFGVGAAYGVSDVFTAISRSHHVAEESSNPFSAAFNTVVSWDNLNPFPGIGYMTNTTNGGAEK